jgi:hypothetical protein
VQPPGWSPDETERYVTIPLEVGLSGMQGLAHIRSQSLFQLSDVKCYFMCRLTRLLQPPMRVIAYRWLEGRKAKGAPTPSVPAPPQAAG